jgi:hypothetical protein
MEAIHAVELSLVVFGIYALVTKLFNHKTMDVYDSLDHDAKLICDAMWGQTNIVRLRYFYKYGSLLLVRNYSDKVDKDLLDSYLNIVWETYLLCKSTLAQNYRQSIASLN